MSQSPVWRKSSYSTEQNLGTCVEVARLDRQVGVRDSKNPVGPHLTFTRNSWAAFVGAVKSRAI
ncbi:DUF397 domain-containing protein [Streptosporangium longisporum]|uniref:DUF397 domain-containing protein n=1 Tax=Streptosporangium longisporum TaxID=46187 RepID=A0ABP6KL41_9ACTN